MTSAHDFTFVTLAGAPYPLRALAGRPILVVNTASRCGFTPQYAGLQNLWRVYGPRGLAVVGVPCNDFGGQEPGEAAEIGAFCERNYGVTFPLMAKARAAGEAAHPFFRWVAAEKGFLARPRWNFYKYLIGKDGALRDFFISPTRPESRRVRNAVEAALTAPG
ncbi:glutathione peroxidase [Acidocella sp.]|uniref:glutathione peroxidase n=1 Tax=Acidocella sp. TaxID=50710 RepID=UPI002623AF9E|nr:glutathione peroxidase [Acidocella sp.]